MVIMEYIELGPTPTHEECVQVGSPEFDLEAPKEMKAFINQLKRQFPQVEKSKTLSFSIKWFPHDFGTYGEVVINYFPGSEEEDIVYKVESELPLYWDTEARIELGLLV
jgi:hypothetical protein